MSERAWNFRTSLVAVAALAIFSSGATADPTATLASKAAPGKIMATASGHYGIAGTTAAIALRALQIPGQDARGTFRTTLVFQGLLIDFSGGVTCMAVDSVNGRAWIGGIVTENNSDHPNFTTEIHQPGKDVWFRVLDTGQHSGDPDRTTFFGFEGSGGIITSAEYCAAQIWPGPPDDEPNARTSALVDGKIKVKPNVLSDDKAVAYGD